MEGDEDPEQKYRNPSRLFWISFSPKLYTRNCRAFIRIMTPQSSTEQGKEEEKDYFIPRVLVRTVEGFPFFRSFVGSFSGSFLSLSFPSRESKRQRNERGMGITANQSNSTTNKWIGSGILDLHSLLLFFTQTRSSVEPKWKWHLLRMKSSQ